MASCKCRYCQANLATSLAYKVESKNKKAYFCDEEHYRKYLEKEEKINKQRAKEKSLHDRVCELFAEILGVVKITNTALYKEKSELNEVYSDETIISYLEENKGWMTTSVSRLSGGIYGKIRYVSVILRNKLGDYKPKVVVREVVVPKIVVDNSSFELFEPTIKKQERKYDIILEDVEDDLL